MARSRSGARRYAKAAFEIALRDGSVEEWRSDLDTAAAIVGDERLGHALANPAMPLEERAEHLDAILQAPGRELVTRPVRNLIQLLLRRGRIEELPRVAAEFRRLDNHRQGITSAVATSAAPLTD